VSAVVGGMAGDEGLIAAGRETDFFVAELWSEDR
jgi:hypothetical protein